LAIRVGPVTEAALSVSQKVPVAMADDDLPIDVHYDKLIDWLVDRKKVSKDWRKKLAGVHAKLSELARDLPNTLTKTHGLGVPDSSLVDAAGEPQRWDYFRAVLVRDRIVAGADLREDRSKSDPDGSAFPDVPHANATDPSRDDDTEKETKEKTRGLFGRLTGKAKAWDDVVRMYEKDALHLPECGSTMTRFADYDAPFARREKERLAKQLGDAERREAEHRRSAAAAKEKFAKMCFDVFGTEKGATIAESVDGDKNDKNDLSFFQSLVDGLADGLDAVFDAAVAAARSDAVGEAAEHYARWTDWAHGERIRAGFVSQETGESLDGRVTVESLTPHLARLRAMATSAEAELIGRDFEKSRKAGPRKDAEDAAFASTSDVDVATDVEVATSADGAQVEPPAGGIDWDVGVVDAKVEPPAGGIDWDVGVVDAKVEPPAGGIDWTWASRRSRLGPPRRSRSIGTWETSSRWKWMKRSASRRSKRRSRSTGTCAASSSRTPATRERRRTSRKKRTGSSRQRRSPRRTTRLRLRSGAPSPIASSALACWTTCSSSARFSRSARRMPARRANPRRFSRRRRQRSARVSATPPNL
jgi:hypothetical protein